MRAFEVRPPMVVLLLALAVATTDTALASSGDRTASARPPAPITGTLSRAGYTVIALTSTGRAVSVRARTGSFTLRPPASTMTLQLRAPNGVYAGPVVIGSDRHGARAILGVRAGARLGRITVSTTRGDAKVARRVATRWVDPSRWARARAGVPIGAGNFGRVRSTPPRVPPPGDLDADGVPDRLDIDINGNLILNKVDRSSAGRAQTAQTASSFFIGVNLPVPIADNLNANASAITDEQIDRTLATWQFIGIGILPGSPELDCGGVPDPGNPQGWIGGLSYCRRGGTGEQLDSATSPPTSRPFPACCDADGDGFGELVDTAPPSAAAPTFSLIPRATSRQIGTGDVLIERVTTGGVTTETPTMLPFVFATAPALVSYDDGQGNAVTLKYPLPPNAGTMGNEFPVAAGPTGDVTLRLTFWRPQRRPIPPEPGDWTDIGKLRYSATVQSAGASCPQSSFSADDPNLAPNPPTDRGGLTDLAPDRPADAANTITYTLNLSSCMAAAGATWKPGETALVNFSAVDGNGPGVSEVLTWAMFKRR